MREQSSAPSGGRVALAGFPRGFGACVRCLDRDAVCGHGNLRSGLARYDALDDSLDDELSHVHSDNAGGAAMAVSHLLARGRRTVTTISGPLDMDVARSRLQGWREALEKAGHEVTDRLVASADFTEEGGEAAMRSLLERVPELDAVFVASDVMAVGALAELRRQKRSVPDDVAVVGFDDSIIARHSNPPLTSVRQPVEEIGSMIAHFLLKEIDNPEEPRQRVVLPTELVVRESS
nr:MULTISPECIES: substrate-binding domain-containing protein [Actinomycetes]WKX07024.1 substrate-binding domain-containing protein [Kutzneria buriramensis]